MSHIHELIDYTVTCFILHPTEPRVLLIDHKALHMWLPVGGHIELDEDPDQALLREVKEECGLEIDVFNERHPGGDADTKMLWLPDTMDTHRIGEAGHWHVNLGYSARAKSADAVLAPAEHHDIRWFTAEDLQDPALNIKPVILQYALAFLKKYAR